MNFLFNAYLGRVLELKDFALLSLVSSFLYIAQIPFGALGAVVSYRTAFLEERFNAETAQGFRIWLRSKLFYFALVVSGLWFALSPFLSRYFSSESILPYIVFSPIWVVGLLAAIDRSFMSGKLLFGSLAIVTFIEPILKLISAYVLVEQHYRSFVYLSIPVSIFATYGIGALMVKRHQVPAKNVLANVFTFPKKFFFSSLFSGLSTLAFLSFDIILANRYLSPEDAGRYALVSLVGKMVFFLASLSHQFTLPLVSRKEGARKDTRVVFYAILLSSIALSTIGFILFGALGYITIPFLFATRAHDIIAYLPYICFAMLLFSTSRVFISYHQARNLHSFAVVSFLLALVQAGLILLLHDSIEQFVFAMLMTAELSLLSMALMHYGANWVQVVENNIVDLLSLLFEKGTYTGTSHKNMRILIVNWRDTRHVWAGGAEVYVHEIAKNWVKAGHQVTIFCGNDAHNPRNEVLDGVQVVRRGGSYTVYIWAFLYFVLRFRNRFDVIIDSENGIPFFTPMYANIPVFLLIHHVHQDDEIFKGRLVFPFTHIARFLESKAMPFVYRNCTVVTVSDSSKKHIIKLDLAKSRNIEIVNPGVTLSTLKRQSKTANPTFLYLGRLKAYKNIDIAIRAFATVATSYPKAMLSIVGEGEMMDSLIKLTHELKIADKVMFYGKVTDHEKALLLAQSWGVLQPSQLEGWGITVIEANAHGTPVIASDVPGLRDSVVDDQTGVLVKLRDVDAFAQAMTRMIKNNQLRRTLSESAYAWSSNFTWERSAEKMLRIITTSVEDRIQYKSAVKWLFAK
ncbi:glycosyltransferase [Candidatus Roizmanbacteria bacterium]|nr:glycosyltransferase [Candidatus Roizmanbacteria bacterium]